MEFVKALLRTNEPQPCTGSWQGYYEQNGSRHPIAASLTQQQDVLTGWMSDGDTVHEESFSHAYTRAGLPPAKKEENTQRVRAWVLGRAAADDDTNNNQKDVDAAPMKTVSIISKSSRLLGTVKGTTLEFVKTYQGAYYAGVDVGDRAPAWPATTTPCPTRDSCPPTNAPLRAAGSFIKRVCQTDSLMVTLSSNEKLPNSHRHTMPKRKGRLLWKKKHTARNPFSRHDVTRMCSFWQWMVNLLVTRRPSSTPDVCTRTGRYPYPMVNLLVTRIMCLVVTRK
jgi:hypothetical protein